MTDLQKVKLESIILIVFETDLVEVKYSLEISEKYR